jgi:hypothetical protein
MCERRSRLVRYGYADRDGWCLAPSDILRIDMAPVALAFFARKKEVLRHYFAATK